MGRERLFLLFLGVCIATLAGCAPRGTPAPLIIGNSSASDGASGNTPPEGAVVVKPGDTLSAIARYHNTALQALVEANALRDPNLIRPGQILRLPAQNDGPLPASPSAPAPPGRSPAPQTLVQSAPLPAPAAPPVPAGGAAASSTPLVTKPGPASAPVPVAPPPGMAAANGVRDEGEDQTGLRVETGEPPLSEDPGREPEAPKQGNELAAAFPPPVPVPVPTPVPAPAPKPAIAPPSAPSSQETMRFLWPATGPILSDFGPKPNGLHNDGINIAMPPNAPVFAAGDGEVIYAGDGLRGYGNMLLIRHSGGWVTAYAHNAKLLVERGDRVKRGQAIAKAGRSGGVSQDQLHFEIRQGARAVNPKPLLVEG